MLLSATVFFAGAVTAQAMEIERFDKLAIPDQGDYVALLLQGAQKMLLDSGKHDQLAKLNRLFTEVQPGDQMSIGMLQFEANLDKARLLDAERYAKDHKAVRLEVEHAMLVTLKRNGIVLTPAFMHVADNFRPKLPPRYR
jgi:hypothetical protein